MSDGGPAGPPAVPPADDGKVAGCELCEAARFTPWHHEDELCWVADCEACDVPIVVWNRHGTEPSEADLERMLGTLQAVADRLFGPEGWYLDRNMRQIPDHFHAHGRANDWLARRNRSR
ncbi:MAG TPA: hypothetical protein VMU63_04950 [Acidimicrobiales bacterium]|nr:hypothetical protein [Acidimicrobiales bacterium]